MAAAMDEMAAVTRRIDPDQVEVACTMICVARHIMLYGCGREGLQMQGLAMRFHHLGRSVSKQRNMSAPPMGVGDLFVVSDGPGRLAMLAALFEQAKAGGSQVLLFTAQAVRGPALKADPVLVIPAQTMASDVGADRSVLPMGSLYESAMGVLFDAMVGALVGKLAQTADSIRARHTNME